jgi:hypothetical protein
LALHTLAEVLLQNSALNSQSDNPVDQPGELMDTIGKFSGAASETRESGKRARRQAERFS